MPAILITRRLRVVERKRVEMSEDDYHDEGKLEDAIDAACDDEEGWELVYDSVDDIDWEDV